MSDDEKPCAECGSSTTNTPDGVTWLCLWCERVAPDEDDGEE